MSLRKEKNCLLLLFFVSCNIQTTHARYIVFGSSFCFPWSNNAMVDHYQPSCCSHILHTPLWVLWVQLFHIHKIFEKVCKYVCLWMCVSESASFRDCDRQLKPFTQQYPISSGLYSLVSSCPSLLGLTGARWRHNTMRYNKKVSRWQGSPQASETNLCSFNKWLNEIFLSTMTHNHSLDRLGNPSAVVQFPS